MVRTFSTSRLEHKPSQIGAPQVNLNWVALGVVLIGLGGGLGWWLMVSAILTVLTPKPLFHWTVSAGLFALFSVW